MAEATPMGNAATIAPMPRQSVPTMQGRIPPFVMDSSGACVRNSQVMAFHPLRKIKATTRNNATQLIIAAILNSMKRSR